MTQAVFVSKETFDTELTVGLWYIEDVEGEEGKEVFFHFMCPCGCGSRRFILAGRGYKPDYSPTWNWNESFDSPTLKPSVNINNGHWHGFLTDGVWNGQKEN